MNTPDTIKLYLKAKTAEGIKNKMIENNIKTNSYSNYQIIFDGQFWYAWYEGSADTVLRDKYDAISSDQG